MDRERYRELYKLNRKHLYGKKMTDEERLRLQTLLHRAKEDIDSMNDDFVVFCMRERFLDAKKWADIADDMGQLCADSVRKCCDRAIERYERYI